MSRRVLGPMFHGTTKRNAERIRKEGSLKPGEGIYGKGVYVTPSEESAVAFAHQMAARIPGAGDEPTVLRGAAYADNPHTVKSGGDFYEDAYIHLEDEFGDDADERDPVTEYSRHLRNKGHDALVVEDEQTVVLHNPHQFKLDPA